MKSKFVHSGKRLCGICLLLSMAIFIGCSESKPAIFRFNEPPSAEGIVDGQTIKFIKGSYQWNNAVADAPSPDLLVKDATVYVVKPNAELTITFNRDKPDNVSATLWGEQTQLELAADGDAWILPSEPGAYVLHVWGHWAGDDRCSYAAAIEVQQ